MWFPTLTKLEAAILSLLEKMGIVHLEMEAVIADSQVFNSVLGPSLEYQQFQSGGETIMQALMSTLRLLRSGGLSVGDVNNKTENASKIVRRHEDLFRAMQVAHKAGADAVDRHFESK